MEASTKNPPVNSRRSRRLALLLFVALTCCQSLLLEGHINTPDGQLMYKVAESTLQRGEVSIRPISTLKDFGIRVGTDHRSYAKYGLGMSLLEIPTLLVGEGLVRFTTAAEADLFAVFQSQIDELNQTQPPARKFIRILYEDVSPANFRELFLQYCANYTSCWLVAAIGVMLFLVSLSLGFGEIPGLILALASNFATPLWSYAGETFSEPAAALCLIVYLWLCLAAWRDPARRVVLQQGAGFILGFLLLIKVAHAIALPAATVYFFLGSRRHGESLLATSAGFVRLASGAAGPVLGMMAYNFSRFGSLFETGYGSETNQWTSPFLSGFFGLLLSPGRGLFLYCPLLLLSLWGSRAFWRRCRSEAIFVALLGLSFPVVYANWYMWEGGWCWGPRFLVPVVPLLLLPLLPLLQNWSHLSPVKKNLMRGIGGLSAVVAASALLVTYSVYSYSMLLLYRQDMPQWRSLGYTNYYDLIRFSWAQSPLWRYYDYPVRQVPLVLRAVARPGMVLGMNMVALSAGIWAVFSLWKLWRAEDRSLAQAGIDAD